MDPVCGMIVDPTRAAGDFEHGGKKFYFCSKGCLAKFAGEPEKYLISSVEQTGTCCGVNKNANDAASLKDPLCGMTVNPATAAGFFDHDGEKYCFCSKRCLAKFAAAPDKYLAGHIESTDTVQVTGIFLNSRWRSVARHHPHP
jgi:P-type Cu+ transporter